jgi:hypothetical protein
MLITIITFQVTTKLISLPHHTAGLQFPHSLAIRHGCPMVQTNGIWVEVKCVTQLCGIEMFHFLFLAVMEFELRALHILGRHSIT